MPRKAHLVLHFSTSELKKRYQQSRNPIESRRWHLLWKVAQGWTIKNSAVAVGLNYGYAQRIVKNYNRAGEAGVKVKPRAKAQHTGGKKTITLRGTTRKINSSPSRKTE